MHIQTRIVDLVPDKDNIVTTRLLVGSRDIGCLDGAESLSEIKKLTGAVVEILPKEKIPLFISGTDELVQVCSNPLMLQLYAIRPLFCAYDESTALLAAYTHSLFLSTAGHDDQILCCLLCF